MFSLNAFRLHFYHFSKGKACLKMCFRWKESSELTEQGDRRTVTSSSASCSHESPDPIPVWCLVSGIKQTKCDPSWFYLVFYRNIRSVTESLPQRSETPSVPSTPVHSFTLKLMLKSLEITTTRYIKFTLLNDSNDNNNCACVCLQGLVIVLIYGIHGESVRLNRTFHHIITAWHHLEDNTQLLSLTHTHTLLLYK